MDAEIKKISPRLGESKRTEIVSIVAQRIGFNTADDMYNAIGYGELTVIKVMRKLQDAIATVLAEDTAEATPAPVEMTVEQVVTAQRPRHLRSNSGIVVDGQEGCAVKFARCCNPLPGDDVIGFVTKGYGISIHKQDCPNVIQGIANPDLKDRWVKAWWESSGDRAETQSVYEALLQVHTMDTVGVLADITNVLADMKVSILQINSQKANGGRAIINLKISCKNVEHYNSIVSRLRSIIHVIDVVRGFS